MSHIVDSISFGAIVAVRDRLLAQQARGKTIYRLESGDPSFDLAPHVREAIEQALARGDTHYTASAGIQPLCDAIVEKVQHQNRLPMTRSDQVIVTSGGMHAIYVTFRALLEPGDEVILPDPMWTEIAENIRLAGGVPVRCPLEPLRSRPYAASQIAQYVTPKTKAIFVNTPHNPTGVVLDERTLREIVELAVARNLTIVSDEAYEHVVFDGERHVSIGSLAGAEDRTISLFSTSKSYAMSGLRIGYIVTRDERVLDRGRKLLRCTTNGVSSIAQWGALAALTGPQDQTRTMAAEYQHRRDLLLSGLQGVEVLRPVVPKGSFFLWASIDPSWVDQRGHTSDQAMVELLVDEAGIGCSPGSAFGPSGGGWIRFAFSCTREQVEQAAKRLHDLLA